MANKNNTQGFDWDETISEEAVARKGGFTYLKPGIYPFTVDSTEKAMSGTGKPMLKAVLIFEGDEGESKVFWQSVLPEPIGHLFISTKVYDKTKTVSEMMLEAYSAKGVAKIKDSNRTSDNGVPYSEVDRFYSPEDAEYKKALPDDAEMEW